MQRNELLQKLNPTSDWDIVIIGGGATGLGAALDAADRGYKTLLIEKSDFAKGTSSKSTKLIHGGVRYLEQGNFRLVKEALEERGYLLKNAPYCTTKVDFILPVYIWWRKFYYYLGLKLYEWLASDLNIGKTGLLSTEDVIQKMPGIKKKNLKGGVLYFDGQFNDSLLCIRIAQTAVEKGATVLNYCNFISFNYTEGKISGLNFRDEINNQEYSVRTKAVINASGAFTDNILKADNAQHKPIVSPSLGIHLVVNKKTGLNGFGLLIPKTTDGRVLFAIPWMDKLIIGTTDTKIEISSHEPEINPKDVDFIIHNINQYLDEPLSGSDVLSVFAGIRPLVKGSKKDNTSSLPRDHTILTSESGLVTITGGKWTTYRKMAEDVVSRIAIQAGLPEEPSRTRNIFLEHTKYSKAALQEKNPEMDSLVHPDFEYTYRDVYNAVKYEMAIQLEDVLARRLRLLFLDAEAAEKCAPAVAEFIQKYFNYTDEWKENQLDKFRILTNQYRFKSS